MAVPVHKSPNSTTFAVWQWPEFKAFMARLGVTTDRVYDMHIHLPHEGIVSVSMEQQATDMTCARQSVPPPPPQPQLQR